MKSRAFVAQFVSVISLLLMLGSVQAGAATVKSVRIWRAPDNTRLVFDLSGPVEHKLFDMPGEKSAVQRIEVAIDKADFAADTKTINLANTPVARLTHQTEGAGERVVIELNTRVKPKSFLLPANEQYGDRLVIDLFDEDKQVDMKTVKPAANGLRDIVVAIDAGHGGEDPGARGPGSILEKNVTLAIARELLKLINDTPGYSAFLTRSGDYYVSLRGRTQIARTKGADLFVSIHADAFKDNTARGASVFALSQRGATSETARWLEKQENDADLVGGVNLGDKDPMLQGVLLDLSMTATIANSLDMGEDVLGQIKKITGLHRGYVEQAGFVVLKNPDIPSLLVETGFITNAQEAKNLASADYRNKMAKAVFAGIDSHFRSKPPMDTALAAARGGKVIQTTDKLLASPEVDVPVAVQPSVTTNGTLDDAIADEEHARESHKNNDAVTEVKVSRDTAAAEKAASEQDAMEKLLSENASRKKLPVTDKKSNAASAGETAKTLAVNSKSVSDKRDSNKKDSSKKDSSKKDSSKKDNKSAKLVEHVVVKGETLGGIAQQYKVSVGSVRDQNKLADQTVRVGQTLRIPVAN